MNPRPIVQEGGLARKARDGDGLLAFLDPQSMAVDAASTITWANMAGGLVIRSGATANRIDTTDTAANILAGNPGMEIGEAFIVIFTNQVAFTITLAGGTSVTASGNLVIAANGWKMAMFTKTSATTMTMIGF